MATEKTWEKDELMGSIWEKRSMEVRGHGRDLMDHVEEPLAV
jgi:hypothetical protein